MNIIRNNFLNFLLCISIIFATACASGPRMYEKTYPLHYAASVGDVAKVNLLLAQGADVNARDARSLTPLMFASKEGHVEIVRILLQNGCDIEIRDEDKWFTALFFAGLNEHEDVLELLIENGTELNPQTKNYNLCTLAYANVSMGFAKYCEKKGLITEAIQNYQIAKANYEATAFHYGYRSKSKAKDETEIK